MTERVSRFAEGPALTVRKSFAARSLPRISNERSLARGGKRHANFPITRDGTTAEPLGAHVASIVSIRRESATAESDESGCREERRWYANPDDIESSSNVVIVVVVIVVMSACESRTWRSSRGRVPLSALGQEVQ